MPKDHLVIWRQNILDAAKNFGSKLFREPKVDFRSCGMLLTDTIQWIVFSEEHSAVLHSFKQTNVASLEIDIRLGWKLNE